MGENGTTPGGDSVPDPLQPPRHDGGADPYYSEPVQYAPVGARIPDRLAQGVLSTGAIVMNGPTEFVIDFVQSLTRPPRVAARVVVTPLVMAQFVAALKDNLEKYERAFGPPKLPPSPPPSERPTVKDIYRDLRLPDEQLSGAYATTIMIGHSPSEFFLEFITRFYPQAAVSARVYMSASRMPGLLATLTSSLEKRTGNKPPPQEPVPPPG
jgi:hypothetical protein